MDGSLLVRVQITISVVANVEEDNFGRGQVVLFSMHTVQLTRLRWST